MTQAYRPVRLVATDLDGTIVDAAGRVSPRTVRALRSAVDAGVRLVLVTGRPPRWIAEVADQLGHVGYAVCANGAAVIDLATGAVVESTPLPTESAVAAVRLLREALHEPTFAAETVDGFVRAPDYVPRWDADQPDVRPIEDVLADAVLGRALLKLLVRDETSTGDAMLATASPLLAGVVVPTHSNTADCLLEVSALGVDKGATLARLAASWGIAPDEAVAFGDMPNDVPMLTWAGRGYAMSGGHPAALAATPWRAPSITDDGVARVIAGLTAAGEVVGTAT